MLTIDARAWPPMTDGIDVGDAEGTCLKAQRVFHGFHMFSWVRIIKTPCRWSMDEYGIHDSMIFS